ncbi:MAG: phosphatase PAP2 family protein [Bacteroidaceae bacterium]|jgi:undecaprenyl-diphosphatase|nr:phosphatase PAP2 family protein [Bacteroidaceae bacterium]
MDTSTAIIDFDKYLLLAMNGSDSIFWDGCMKIYTTISVWIPLILILLYILVKNNSLKDFLLLLLFVALVVTFTDVISSRMCKPFFERWRPTNDPELMYLVDVVDNIRGGKYGFTSSHAANSFGIATFLLLLVKNRALSFSLILWAALNAFTRIYLGVHYPGDILAGTLIGVTVGVGLYGLYRYVLKRQKHNKHRDWISDQYTKTGYLVSDIYLLLLVMYGTFAAIPLISFVKFVY